MMTLVTMTLVQVHAEPRTLPDPWPHACLQPLPNRLQRLDVQGGNDDDDNDHDDDGTHDDAQGWDFYMTGQYNWVCEPVDYGSSPLARRALNLAWWYYFSKEMIIATGLMAI